VGQLAPVVVTECFAVIAVGNGSNTRVKKAVKHLVGLFEHYIGWLRAPVCEINNTASVRAQVRPQCECAFTNRLSRASSIRHIEHPCDKLGVLPVSPLQETSPPKCLSYCRNTEQHLTLSLSSPPTISWWKKKGIREDIDEAIARLDAANGMCSALRYSFMAYTSAEQAFLEASAAAPSHRANRHAFASILYNMQLVPAPQMPIAAASPHVERPPAEREYEVQLRRHPVAQH
jgi:hypothetical protein